MKGKMILAAALLVPSWAGAFSADEIEAASKDPQAYTLDVNSIEVVRLDPSQDPGKPPVPGENAPAPAPIPPVSPDIIVNIGKIIWEIIEANRPVVDIKQSYATAVPDGVTHWTQLAGWKPPEVTVYEFTAKNLKWEKAIQVRFQVMRTAGGKYKDKGDYLTGVTVEPLMISVTSGFKFYLEAAVPKESVVNVGSQDDPVAGMIAALRWKIQTVWKETRGARLYYLQGDGLFKEITGTSGSLLRHGESAIERLGAPAGW